MGQVMMIRRGSTAAFGAPTYTYTGTSQLFDEGNGNWRIHFLTSGTFTSNQDAAIQIYLIGGGGAGNQKGGGGGGGYSANTTGIAMLRNVAYAISIGAGGTTTGAAGSKTTAFGSTGNGGGGGVAGTITGQTCVVIGTGGSAGNVYYYSSLKASAVSIGNGQKTVNLAHPITSAYHNNGTYLLKGVSGYYRCNIVSYGAYIGTNGSNGAGGAATYAFGATSGTQYGGAGSAPSTANGAANTGKGGGGSNNYNGTAFGKGGSGIVIIRNVR